MTRRWSDLLLVLMIGVLWGLNWPAVKLLLGEWPPWTLRGASFAIAAVILFAVAAWRRERLRPQPGEWGLLIWAGLLSVFSFNILVAFGQLLTDTSNATIIAFTMPAWAMVLSVVFLGEMFTVRRALALGLGMSGLGVLVWHNFSGFVDAPAGPLVVLAGAWGWAAGTVLLKLKDWTIGPVARAGWMLAVSMLPALAGAAVFEWPGGIAMLTPTGLGLLAFHVLGPMVACYAAWTVLVARLAAPVAAIGTLVIPVVGVLSSGLLPGEVLGWQKIVALALVVSSIALTFAGRRKA